MKERDVGEGLKIVMEQNLTEEKKVGDWPGEKLFSFVRFEA
jgi:hypothetical protein